MFCGFEAYLRMLAEPALISEGKSSGYRQKAARDFLKMDQK